MMTNSPLYIELFRRLSDSLKTLPDKPEETHESCLRALWHKAAGFSVSANKAMIIALPELEPDSVRDLHAMVDARLEGHPLAYLVGRQQFMGIDFISTPQAVIPRKDTEPLVKAVLKHLHDTAETPDMRTVIDVFTGSGNVPLALASGCPGPRYHGSDMSEDAISLAGQNLVHLNLESACTFYCGDLLSPFQNADFLGQVDVVCGAPPFISSSKVPNMPEEISRHEPSLAFDAGPFGVALFLRLISDAPKMLKAGGWLFFEVGLGQGVAMHRRLDKDPLYMNAATHCDDRGDIRVVAAQKR